MSRPERHARTCQRSFAVIGPNDSSTIHHKSEYVVLNAIGSTELADGKYLYSPATGRIEVQWIQGIGSEKAAAPQARLMATVINGILSRKLPWGLVMLGVLLVIGGGIAGHSFAVVCGGRVSVDRNDAGDFCGRRGAVAC